MPWPLPALLTWAFAWGVFVVARLAGLPFIAAAALATLVGACAALPRRIAPTPWRMALLVLGFPVSLLATGVAPLPAWAWLVPLALLLLLYPLRSWRDAPLFPTPRGALCGLPEVVPVVDGGCIVDAGCGLGDGLIELHDAYPRARAGPCAWRARCVARSRACDVPISGPRTGRRISWCTCFSVRRAWRARRKRPRASSALVRGW
jgi:hypothetical protein